MQIAIIPARGGSKRIPGKNIKVFAGKPIIAHSINAAKESGMFDKVIVSTDSDRIAETAIKYGAEIPFMRPIEIADDYTGTAEVIFHAIDTLQKQGLKVDYACCIYATAPFVQKQYLAEGFEKLKSMNASSVFSVAKFDYPVLRALKIADSGCLKMVWPEHEFTRSNDLADYYHDAGQFYWLNVAKFKESKKIVNEDSLPVILPKYLVQDIDTLEDWITAEKMYKAVNTD